MQTYYIKSYGCQMNVYDSERMEKILSARGLVAAKDAASADIILLNSCDIREKAAEKIYSDLGRIKKTLLKQKSKNKKPIIGVAGCVAQAEGEEIFRRASGVDLIFGPQAIYQLPDMLDAFAKSGEKQQCLELEAQTKFAALNKQVNKEVITRKKILNKKPSAFLTIQEGCDKFCNFCVVPYTRGGEVSRDFDEICVEAEALVEAGVCDITLLGQNVNAWVCPQSGAGLAVLLERLAQLDGVKRLRFTTSHPRDMDAALIELYGVCEKLMPYLHLPVQSGSDKILGAMNRKHNVAFYLDIIARLKNIRPDIALSSDFIVGFPGESEEDFNATLALVEKVGFAQSYSFKYSPRPGTPAAALPQIDEAVKMERLARLQEALRVQSRAFCEGQIGRVLPVLFDSYNQKTGQLSGRSPYQQPVHIIEHIIEPLQTPLDEQQKKALYGQIMPVAITAAGANSLSGEIRAQV